jgi:uncharacterized repeat protein (TIGR03806 family)
MKKISVLSAIGIALFMLVFFSRCMDHDAAVVVDANYKEPFKKLSQYHFFKDDLKELMPNDRVLAYDLITPLFSDYALKARFVWMPEGTSARYVKDEVLDFPVGTVLIKNFYYPYDFRDESKGRRIIETRLLIHKQDKWDALTYVWNAEQNDANLNIIGDTKSLDWTDKNSNKVHDDYSVPNKNQCKTCHSYNGAFIPIGPKVRNLNQEYLYGDSKQNQLDKWVAAGYLTGYNKADNISNRMAKWDDSTTGNINARARAYLDVNCAHCHRKEGMANPSGLYLTFANQDAGSLGMFKTPEAAGGGGGDFLYDIIPGKPDESIMPHRMMIDEPGKMMPQIGRKLVHTEGVALIKQWIAGMKDQPAAVNKK